ncbi:MAG TPA: DUF4167 domain-containing protein [Croceicoccus sp.]|nr:DUF4167 domain-containing protein [Croceicoccus sp.]
MNNNRGNNRRRGRNNRQQGGGQHLNRIDSRARGNAPQMLDKYKKLAEEAHRNGDRVQAEYYLQFADHYFRVIADGKTCQEEQQQPQRGRRDDDRDRYDDRYDDADADGQDNDNDAEQEAEAAPRRERRRDENNPFTRESRQRRPRRDADDGAPREETEEAVTNDGGLDPQALPPAIGETEERPRRRSRLAIADSVDDDEAPAPSAPVAEEEAKPKRRGRPRKVRPEDGEVAQAVNG